ncbi:MAG: HAMP domain-containing sensor histidine kinase [Phycisphaeraceae bacterium]
MLDSDMSHQSNNTPPEGSRLRLAGTEPMARQPQRAPGMPREPAKLVHELANLLDGSLRNVGLALGRLKNEPQAEDQTLEQLAAADAALRQMADLLRGWRKGGAAEARPAAERHATMRQLADQVVHLMRPVAQLQNIELASHVDAAAAQVEMGAIYPVLVNGVKNAIEAVERDGHVWMDVERFGGELQIQIADDGPGVDEHLPRDEDGLVKPGVTTKEAGSGLGLAISRDMVRGLGGVIRLEPNEPRGTVMLIRVPIGDKR